MPSEDSIPSNPPAEFIAAVLDSIEESLVAIDATGIVTTWNAAAEKLYGHPRHDTMGRQLADLAFPAELTVVQDRLFEAVKSTVRPPEVVHVTRAPEMKVAVTITPLLNGHGDLVGASASGRDVSAQNLAERQQQDASQRLQMVIENAREYAIITLDLDRRVTSWNSGAEALLGYAQDEILGRSGDIIFTADDREAGIPVREALIATTNGRAADERWHVRKDGSRFWGSGVLMVMHDGDKELVGLVKIFRDQTAEVESKRALERSLLETEQAREEAEAAIQVKNRFFALISHELRTPLTPIVMALETLSRNKDLPPGHHAILAMIKRNVQIEARFIDDLLDVTRIAHGKLELASEVIDVHDMIRQALEVTRSDLEAKNQGLTLSLEAAESRMRGDSARLQQIFWNLIKNASKFTPEGGAIHVCSRLGEENGERKWLIVEIDDTGIGFDPAIAEKIFDAFAQGDSSVTRKYGGLGLGLAISKAAVEAHEGKLSAYSDGPGHGAVFRVELPLNADGEPDEATA